MPESAATCALCLYPITEGQHFVISETEAMHRDCARRGGTSLIWRVRQELNSAKAEIATAQRTVEHLRTLLRDTRAERDRLTRAVRGLETSLTELSMQRPPLATPAMTLDQRREVTVQLTPPPIAPTIAQPVDQQAARSARDARDDTEIRMGLLELDGHSRVDGIQGT